MLWPKLLREENNLLKSRCSFQKAALFTFLQEIMANVIVNRVKEFLQSFPPFSFLEDEALMQVANAVEIRFFGKDEFLFEQGEPAQDCFFVLKEGAVHLTHSVDGKPEIYEKCDEGDIFGVMALMGKRPYRLNALAFENSLVYAVPVHIFESILKENNRVALYFAAGFASGQVVVRTDLSKSQKAREALGSPTKDIGLLLFTGQSEIQIKHQVLTCEVGEPVHVAAKKMAQKGVGSIIIVDDRKLPLGIITDKDLRNRLVAEQLPYDTPVEMIMTSPLVTMKPNANFPDLYLTMVRQKLHHLIFTEDGTMESPVNGIISDHDILLAQGNSPAVLIHGLMNTWEVKEIAKIRNRAEGLLKYYLENEVSMDFVANIISEINDIIIQRAIIITKKRLDPEFPDAAKVKFCFISLGSEGREEQLLRTDLDNALVYEDMEKEEEEKVRPYLLKLTEGVIDILLACGFHTCPAEMMANNPKWCQPLSQWKKYFTDWISDPTEEALIHAVIFFDFRPVYGQKKLSEAMAAHIYQEIQGKSIFLNFLAKNALLNPAPLGFFRNFVVEKSGEHRDKFDIKMRAMMPLTDIARLLVLSHKLVDINNTFRRYERLAELEPNNRDLYLEAAKAYEILMRIRAIEGLKSSSSGRYIDPVKLGKLQRQLLKNAFAPIDELQQIIKVRYQLDFFRS
jgi:CBS domain-containing protein